MLLSFHPRKNARVEIERSGLLAVWSANSKKKGAMMAEEVRASVMAVWKALKPSKLEKNVDRMRRNATKVVELNGGNFYNE